MKCIPLLLALASCAFGATVQGVIFDEETTNPIARAIVTLVPLPGTAAPEVSIFADEHGRYVFAPVQLGLYLVRATRIGFKTAEFGQLRPGLPGIPLQVTDQFADADLHQILMRRQAAISGSVLDDNSIGIPDWPVSIYTARQPIRRIAEGKTDDRGDFRIGELERGTYIVRAGGGQLEDATTLVPSYFKYGTALNGAEQIFVRLGETALYTAVHTVLGELFEVNGDAIAPDKDPIRITLITDSGRHAISAKTGKFVIEQVPPGMVEVRGEGPGCASDQTMLVDRNMFARVDCTPLTPPVLTGAGSYSVIARRMDLDGPGEELVLNGRQILSPGPWEFTVHPAASHYLVSIRNQGDATPVPAAIDGWFGVTIGNAPKLEISLSTKPASISGVVSDATKPVVGAPVFLQLVNPDAPELALQTWSVRADPQGHFMFSSLPPGNYRMMSSYQVDYDDAFARDRSVSISLKEGDAAEQSLELLHP